MQGKVQIMTCISRCKSRRKEEAACRAKERWHTGDRAKAVQERMVGFGEVSIKTRKPKSYNGQN
jgi:hypothetical protein